MSDYLLEILNLKLNKKEILRLDNYFYNNKNFCVLVVRKTNVRIFFEIDLNNNYVLPTYEDFISLGVKFNRFNYLLKIDMDGLKENPGQKIKNNKDLVLVLTTLLVTGTLFLGMFELLDHINKERFKEAYAMEEFFANFSPIEVSYSEILSTISVINPSIEQVVDTINSNSNLDSDLKERFIQFVYKIKIRHPDLDLTIMNKNMSTLKGGMKTRNELYMKFGFAVNGIYSPTTNEIYFASDSELDIEDIIDHELGHTTDGIYDSETNRWYTSYNIDGYGNHLSEALNELYMVDNPVSYNIGMQFVKQFVCVFDERTIIDILKKGNMKELVQKLSVLDGTYQDAEKLLMRIDDTANCYSGGYNKEETFSISQNCVVIQKDIIKYFFASFVNREISVDEFLEKCALFRNELFTFDSWEKGMPVINKSDEQLVLYFDLMTVSFINNMYSLDFTSKYGEFMDLYGTEIVQNYSYFNLNYDISNLVIDTKK